MNRLLLIAPTPPHWNLSLTNSPGEWAYHIQHICISIQIAPSTSVAVNSVIAWSPLTALDNLLKHLQNLPRIATISSSWITSKEPVTTKQSWSMLSPWWKIKSPGAVCSVVKLTAKERRQPSLANRKAGCSLKTIRLRWMHRSAFISFGQ